ncbi:MAG: hypothetical protein JO256_02530 [Alphaproteobacteria bacterium]|nr:hypothetical protein [Alphaproteobacteria bacterium]
MLRRGLSIVALLLVCVLPARAAVTIDFYSHKLAMAPGLNTYFPHGFVLLSGTTTDGAPVKANLGFTAKNIFINVLWQRIEGELDPTPLPDGYVDGAVHHFSFPLTDAQYRAVLAVADKWRSTPQPSYDIDEHNCVLFVKDLAAAVGLSVSDDKKFIHAPGDFLDDVAVRNAAFLAANGTVYRAGTPAAQTNANALELRVKQLERDARQKAAN